MKRGVHTIALVQARLVIKTSGPLVSAGARYDSHRCRGQRMDEQELQALRQLAMLAAEAYGCHAGIEVMDFLDSTDDPPASLHLKIVVARRSASGQLFSRESNVLLGAGDLAASVERIVRQAAAELSGRTPSKLGLRDTIRQRIENGRLPVNAPREVNAGHGWGQLCAACDRQITSAEMLYEFEDRRTGKRLRFHMDCYNLWREAIRPHQA
jgi:hypothetical protein